MRFEKELSFLNEILNERRYQQSNCPAESDDNSDIDGNIASVDDGTPASTPPAGTASPVPHEESALTSTQQTLPNVTRARSPPPSTSQVIAAKASRPIRPTKRYGRKQQSTVISDYFNYKKQYEASKREAREATNITPKSDHIAKFFQAMEETVRGFPASYQNAVKRRVSSIILELESEILLQQTSSSEILPPPTQQDLPPPTQQALTPPTQQALPPSARYEHQQSHFFPSGLFPTHPEESSESNFVYENM